MNTTELLDAAPAAVEKSTQTERYTCGRCGGTGKYPSSCYNGICLGCNGRGYSLTKRGRVADEYLKRLRSKRVEDLKVGDVIRGEFGFYGQIRAFAPITRLEPLTAQNAYSWSTDPKTGERVFGEGFLLEQKSEKYGAYGTTVAPGTWLRVAQTAEQKQETLRQALAYQDTLTQAGTVRKQKVKRT